MNRNINGLLKAQLLIGLTFVWGGILVIAITGKGLIASLLVFVGALILNVVVEVHRILLYITVSALRDGYERIHTRKLPRLRIVIAIP